MNLEYDSVADAIYIQFREPRGPVKSRIVDDRRIVDSDADGETGVELLFVSEGISLEGLPRRDDIAAALNAIPHQV